jgi:hypothetical protein
MASFIHIPIFFSDSGVPAEDLEPVINAYDVTTGEQVVEDGEVVELGNGQYRYSLETEYPTHTFSWVVDGGDSLDDADRYKEGTWQITHTRRL